MRTKTPEDKKRKRATPDSNRKLTKSSSETSLKRPQAEAPRPRTAEPRRPRMPSGKENILPPSEKRRLAEQQSRKRKSDADAESQDSSEKSIPKKLKPDKVLFIAKSMIIIFSLYRPTCNRLRYLDGETISTFSKKKRSLATAETDWRCWKKSSANRTYYVKCMYYHRLWSLVYNKQFALNVSLMINRTKTTIMQVKSRG